MRIVFTIIFFVLIFFSCEEQFETEPGEMPQKIIEISSYLFPGKIVEQSVYVMDGVDVCWIEIENESGSIVSFYWQKSKNVFFMMEGESGPFNYELKPPYEILSFSTAKFIAFESYSQAELVSWKLKKNSIYKNRWVYQFYLKDIESPIMIDATSGKFCDAILAPC